MKREIFFSMTLAILILFAAKANAADLGKNIFCSADAKQGVINSYFNLRAIKDDSIRNLRQRTYDAFMAACKNAGLKTFDDVLSAADKACDANAVLVCRKGDTKCRDYCVESHNSLANSADSYRRGQEEGQAACRPAGANPKSDSTRP